MFSTDFIFRQQENLVDNQKCQAGFRQLCNKILKYEFISVVMNHNMLNYSELHFSEGTSFKIHTLDRLSQSF